MTPTSVHEAKMRASFLNEAIVPAAVVVGLLLTLPLLSGCRTASGLGQDISAAGHAMTNAAEKHKPGK